MLLFSGFTTGISPGFWPERVDHPCRTAWSYPGLLFARGSYFSGHSCLENRRVKIYDVLVTKRDKEALQPSGKCKGL